MSETMPATLVSVRRNLWYLGVEILGVEFLLVRFARHRTNRTYRTETHKNTVLCGLALFLCGRVRFECFVRFCAVILYVLT